jgi:hypothetical protein
LLSVGWSRSERRTRAVQSGGCAGNTAPDDGVVRPAVPSTAAHRRHEDAAARPRQQEAVVDQLLVGRGHGVAAEADQLRQVTRRGQWRALGQAPGADLAHDGRAQPALQGQRRLVGQIEQFVPELVARRIAPSLCALARPIARVWLHRCAPGLPKLGCRFNLAGEFP